MNTQKTTSKKAAVQKATTKKATTQKKNTTPKESSLKETTNRLNTTFILLTLKNHSSETHPLSILDIQDYVNKEYYHAFYDQTASISDSTISRTLDALMSDPALSFQDEPMDYFDDSANLGFNLYCVMKDKDGNWVSYDASTSKKKIKKYYYYDSVFSDKELITLIHSVETYNYFSTDDIADLVTKLLSLRPNSEFLSPYHTSDGKLLKTDDSLVLANIDEFSRLIKDEKFATITYCNYDYNHELVSRKGYPRLIRPLDMMWSNGYYYLVALLKPGYTPANLRLDRITEIIPYDPTPEMLEDYQVDVSLEVSSYRMNHPVMHGGKVQHITMLYLDTDNFCMSNAMMDTFGKSTKVRPASKEEIQKHLPSRVISQTAGVWYRADFQATTAGTELFATQYSPYCKVISPSSLSNKIVENLQNGLGLYL